MLLTKRCVPALLALLLTCASTARSAIVMSMEDGPWNLIEWEGGEPMAGDTVVVRNTVVAPAEMPAVSVQVRGGGKLLLLTGRARILALTNAGSVELGAYSLLLVDSNVENDGWISGRGTLALGGDGSRLRSSNPIGNLLITGVGVGDAVIEGDCVCSTLVIDADRRLSITGGSLTVMGSYVDRNGPFGTGISCPDGVVRLQGRVSGSVKGSVRLEGDLLSTSGRRLPVTVTGTLGDSSAGVIVAADRVANGALFLGTLVVDADATLTGRGLSGGGTNWVDGTAIVLGTLTSADPDGRWVIGGGVRNLGVIAATTLRFTRDSSHLDASTGLWENDVSVEYMAGSGDTLTISGNPVLARLAIAAAGTTDTGIVVHVVDGSIRVRHEFRSDTSRRCRLVGDSVIRLGGRVYGIINGDVRLDGFWGSEVSGSIGRPGGQVIVSSPKRVIGSTFIEGEVDLRPWSGIDIAGRCFVPDSTHLRGRVVVETGAELRVGRFIRLERGGEGGGDIVVETDTRMETPGSLVDSIGIDVTPTGFLRTDGDIAIPRLRIRLGGDVDYRVGDTITTSRQFIREVSYPGGFSLGSAAVDPFEFAPASVFVNSVPPVYLFEGTYVAATTITPGVGYYVKYNAADTVAMTGRFLNYPLNVPVRAGWNLVGSGSVAARVVDVVPVGTSIETPFYESSAGSGQVTTLEPGRGYWVRVTTDGHLMIHARP